MRWSGRLLMIAGLAGAVLLVVTMLLAPSFAMLYRETDTQSPALLGAMLAADAWLRGAEGGLPGAVAVVPVLVVAIGGGFYLNIAGRRRR